ncbi:hypothetical protein B1R32_1307 [Abditibacterium utsteinense]|uniref:DUF104 domain-containing protein n=1 Tax=Abditibacterium utsteinense TaxID=1960156 RepID=A0A2S8SP03_9BACT|nr:antitoxin family protein [Abditibacterium utsteinense]PQV62520.1 hypothetical protein B1R32_1307 [Abditibacterium utsteinense]
MTQTLEATFDGLVLRPDEPLELAPNTRVRLTVETVTSTKNQEKSSFLRTARNLNLEGPRDWSENLDSYLYDDAKSDGE